MTEHVDVGTAVPTGQWMWIPADHVDGVGYLIGPDWLPAWTASGMDPDELLRVPASVRPKIAREESLEEAQAMVHRHTGLPADEVPPEPSGVLVARQFSGILGSAVVDAGRLAEELAARRRHRQESRDRGTPGSVATDLDIAGDVIDSGWLEDLLLEVESEVRRLFESPLPRTTCPSCGRDVAVLPSGRLARHGFSTYRRGTFADGTSALYPSSTPTKGCPNRDPEVTA